MHTTLPHQPVKRISVCQASYVPFNRAENHILYWPYRVVAAGSRFLYRLCRQHRWHTGPAHHHHCRSAKLCGAATIAATRKYGAGIEGIIRVECPKGGTWCNGPAEFVNTCTVNTRGCLQRACLQIDSSWKKWIVCFVESCMMDTPPMEGGTPAYRYECMNRNKSSGRGCLGL